MDNTFFAGKAVHMIQAWWHWQTHSIFYGFCLLMIFDILQFTHYSINLYFVLYLLFWIQYMCCLRPFFGQQSCKCNELVSISISLDNNQCIHIFTLNDLCGSHLSTELNSISFTFKWTKIMLNFITQMVPMNIWITN